MGVVAVIWLLSFTIHLREMMLLPGWKDVPLVEIVVLAALVIFSGGLWTTLLFRQVGVAFWFTLLTPAMLLVFVGHQFDNGYEGPDQALRRALATTSLLYSVAGFFLARRLFFRAQDRQWSGGIIALPEIRSLSRWLSHRRKHHRLRPRRALFLKEWRLHQSQFVIAGVLALLHLAVVATRKYAGSFKEQAVLQFIVEIFWMLWLAMPWLVGCAAVAEERKLGTLESQLCLPARRRTQFVMKFISTLLVAVALGAVVPVLLEGNRILPSFDPHFGESAANYPNGYYSQFGHSLGQFLSVTLPFLRLAGLAALIGTMSFYASTFSRNTLQAIAPALLGILLIWFLCIVASNIDSITQYLLWHGPLIFIIGVPVMTLTLVGLMYGNFKHVLVGWNVWRRNVLVFLAALAGVAMLTTTIYQRPWELFSKLETPHGAARLNFSQPVQLRVERGVDLSVQFPDGRIWSGRPEIPKLLNLNGLSSPDWSVAQLKSAFLEETNWAILVRGYPSSVGVRKDGSLWVADPTPANRSSQRRGQIFQPGPPHFVRLGVENDWKSVASQNGPFLLLKTDGTLWRLGTNNMHRNQRWPGLLAFAPEHLGADSDWADITSEFGNAFLRKTGGEAWTTQQTGSPKTAVLDLNKEVRLYRAAHLDRVTSFKPTWGWSRRGQNLQVGIFKDGTFRMIASWRHTGFEHSEVQLGSESNWQAVAGNGPGIVTLRADGTLWKWTFTDDPETKSQAAHATRLSRQSDWLAITTAMGGVVALAADGSLWFWQLVPNRYGSSEYSLGPLLAASRRPQLIGNIFAPSSQ